jgi:hypothetical protein
LMVPNLGISGRSTAYYTTKFGLSTLGIPTFLYRRY